MKRLLFALAAVLMLPAIARADEPLKVVASLSTFADLAKAIGGEHVDVTAVASPKFNPHFIEPTPGDVRRVKQAKLFIHGGLDLEAWRGPLLDAAGNLRIMPGQPGELDLSRGIALLEVPDRTLSRVEGDIHLYGNPHYWLDPEQAPVMARAIYEKLTEVDPAHEPVYRANMDAWLARLEAKLPEWRSRMAPFKGRELIGYHREWPYLMKFAGLVIEQYLEPKPGIPPTPRQLEFLERYAKERGIQAIAQASYVPQQAAASLAKRTGAKVVTLCQSMGELKACSDYVGMMEYNIGQLASALEGSSHD